MWNLDSSLYQNFHTSSCLIWHTSFFSPLPSIETGSWKPPFHWDHFRFQWTVDGSFKGPATSLRFCVRALLHFFPISQGKDFQIVFRPANFLRFFKDTLHTMRRYTKIWVMALWKPHCWYKNTILSLSHWVIFDICFCFRLQVTKHLKLQFINGSLVTSLLCCKTVWSHKLDVFLRLNWILCLIHRPELSGLTNKRKNSSLW